MPLWRAARALADGRLEQAATLTAEAGATGAGAGSANVQVLEQVQRTFHGVEAGAPDAIETVLATVASDLFGPTGPPSLAGACFELGRLDDLTARLAAVEDVDAWPVDAEWLPAMVSYVAAATAVGDPALAGAVDRLLPHADLWAVEGIGAQVKGSVGRVLGPALAALGRHDEAVAHAEAAVRRDAPGGRLVGAHARRDLARVLRARAAPGDDDRAATEGAAALDAYRRLGLHRVADRWAPVLGGDEPSPSRSPAPEVPENGDRVAQAGDVADPNHPVGRGGGRRAAGAADRQWATRGEGPSGRS